MKTTSFLISKELAEAKFKANQVWNQEGQFWGYDLETILDALPKFIEYNDYNYCLTLWVAGKQIYYEIIGENTTENDCFIFDIKQEENESLADTAARLWLKLKKEGLV